MKYLKTYVQFLIDSEAGLDKYWIAYTILTDSQPLQTLHCKIGLANKLDILCCWVIFRLITLLLQLIAFNREKKLVIHHTFVDRFYREIFFCQ
jgi:hypothetical protein